MRLQPALQLSLSDLVSTLVQENKPVLFPDTCALLDIIRAPVRDSAAVVKSASDVATRINQSVLPFRIVLSSLFHREWNDNFDTVEKELLKGLSFHKSLSAIVEKLNHSVLSHSSHFPDITGMQVDLLLKQFCDTIIDYADTLASDATISSRGLARHIGHRAPAHEKGEKDTVKDCMIFEEVIAIGSALKISGFDKPVIFVSSNKLEYGTYSVPLNEIAADICDAHVTFTGDIAHGFYLASQ